MRGLLAAATPEKSDDPTCAAFVLMLLHAVTNAHLLHFMTNSFSEHMALGEFYSELQDKVDEFTEAYQGKYGQIKDYPDTYTPPTDALSDLQALSASVRTMRKALPNDTELQNLIDEIAQLIDTTLYKLRFLN